MSNVKKKIKIRQGHRAYLKKILGSASDIITDYHETQENKLKQLKITLQERLDTLKTLDEEIVELIEDDDEIISEIEDAGKYRESVHEVIVNIDSIISAKKGTEPKNTEQHLTTNSNTTESSQTTKSCAKLPRLVLKSFSGEPCQWRAFWDSFKSAVHENPQLCDVDKFNYLKSLLEKTAASTIAGLTLTSSNYTTAIELLEQRFGAKEVVISSHMDTLLKITPLASSADVKGLRRLYDSIEAHVRGLNALEVPTTAYGALLLPVLISKIPEDIRILLGRDMKDDTWDLSVMLKKLREELENRERCEGIQALSWRGNKKPTDPKGRRDDPTTASVLFAGKGKPMINCSFCQQEHKSANCSVVTNVAARKQLLMKQGRCFVCLKRNHIARNCDSKFTCQKCSGRHHISICENAQPAQQQREKTEPTGEKETRSTRNYYVGSQDSVLLQTAKAYVGPENKKLDVQVRVIFDSGSQRSYITQQVRDRLKLPTGRKESLRIKTFGDNETELSTTCEGIRLAVGRANGRARTQIEAFVVPVICSPLRNQEVDRAKSCFAYLRDIELADNNERDCELEIDLLIGADQMGKFFTGKIKRGESDNGPIASETTLGWVLSGPIPSPKRSPLSSVNFVATHVLKATTEVQNNTPAEDVLQRLWDLESIGIKNTETVHNSFENDVSFEDGRYHVKLPLKERSDLLPDNYELSLARLNSQVKRLRREPSLLKEYDKTFKDQLCQGIVEKVENPEEHVPGVTHYLPHQAVVRNDATTTKVRVVFDASAKVKPKYPSLNDCVYTGPSLITEILKILLSFRGRRIGMVADIEKAFLNIAIDEEQRDMMRFLWVDDISKEDPYVEVYRFCRVIFGMKCSPFLLNATLRHHITEYHGDDQPFSQRILSELYVDDWTGGEENEDEAYKLYQKLKSCFAAGNFNLRKWATNNTAVTARILQDEAEEVTHSGTQEKAREDNSYAKESIGGLDEIETPKEHKVLGMNWDLEQDTLVLKLMKVVEFARTLEPTKRNILRIAAKLFDPLGIISPVTVTLRMLLQELCAAKYEWDSPISKTSKKFLQKWIEDMERTNTIAIHRYYFSKQEDQVKTVSLHGFGDASKKAYCAVIYLCVQTNNSYYTNLVASKSRVAPLAIMTIPRLELMAALILARLLSTVREVLSKVFSIQETTCWTDSRAVLYWIQGKKEYKQFVQNRVNEILQLTESENWHHCPGTENPADIGSRGHLPSELVKNELWWKGPAWLREAPSSHPRSEQTEEPIDLPEECTKEIRDKGPQRDNSQSVTNLVNTDATIRIFKPTNLSKIIDYKRYSSFTKICRVTAQVIKFIANLRTKKTKSLLQHKKESLSVEEVKNAEKEWIKELQTDIKNQKNYKDLKNQLGLYADDDNILRCKGRLENASLSEETRNPILLPREHYLTRLMVEASHKKINHGGLKETLTELRSQYWIPRGRQFVRYVVRHCVVCRKKQGEAFKTPIPASLPENRVKETAAFTHVGCDFAGPLYVKTKDPKKQMQKAYICLYTCATSRALHLELVHRLTTEAFIQCLRRFIARRGTPVSITSDNAKTFKSANKELSNLFKDRELEEFLTNKGIHWNFILERAPWWGGYYERMVQLVKRSLRKILGNARLTFEELTTVITEVEGTLNSRPITYVYSDVDEEEPLTPSHLVIGRRLSTLPDPEELSDEEDCNTVVRRQRYLGRLLQHFWNRWKKEYLVDLREFHRPVKGDPGRRIAIGEVVLVQGEDLPRSRWRIGKVEELLQSRDEEVRGAVIRVINKKEKPTLLRRPIQKLFPLEIQNQEKMKPELRNTNEPRGEKQIEREEKRPKRVAAINADLKRRILDQK